MPGTFRGQGGRTFSGKQMRIVVRGGGDILTQLLSEGDSTFRSQSSRQLAARVVASANWTGPPTLAEHRPSDFPELLYTKTPFTDCHDPTAEIRATRNRWWIGIMLMDRRKIMHSAFSVFMSTIPTCFVSICMIIFVFFGTPKVHINKTIWILSWAVAAGSAISVCYMQHGWSLMNSHFGPLPSYERTGFAGFQAIHYQMIWQLLMYTTVSLALPPAWYFGDMRRDRRGTHTIKST